MQLCCHKFTHLPCGQMYVQYLYLYVSKFHSCFKFHMLKFVIRKNSRRIFIYSYVFFKYIRTVLDEFSWEYWLIRLNVSCSDKYRARETEPRVNTPSSWEFYRRVILNYFLPFCLHRNLYYMNTNTTICQVGSSLCILNVLKYSHGVSLSIWM